jgi:hypothetical protein
MRPVVTVPELGGFGRGSNGVNIAKGRSWMPLRFRRYGTLGILSRVVGVPPIEEGLDIVQRLTQFEIGYLLPKVFDIPLNPCGGIG